jgi:pyruvate dehydrogenase E1 component alpha subunit
VDGNDVIALRARIGEAIERARNGGGASLIEAMTYRLCDHTTADDASRYRTQEEVQAAWQLEPVRRLRSYLASEKLWDETREKNLLAECEAEVEAAIQRYLAIPPRKPAAMFDHLYAELPGAFAAQRAELEGRDG